jgi:hypothetical protein
MSTQELFLLANQTLLDVVKQVKEDQMELVLPESDSWMPNMPVRQSLNIHAYENRCVPEAFNGKKDFIVNAEFKEDLLGEHPQENYEKYHTLAQEAVKNLDDPEKIVHITYGDFTATDYLRDIIIERGFAAYDLAKFIGADTTLPDDLVKGLWEITVPVAETLREYGVFKIKIDVSEDAPLQQRLLGLTGRDPS